MIQELFIWIFFHLQLKLPLIQKLLVQLLLFLFQNSFGLFHQLRLIWQFIVLTYFYELESPYWYWYRCRRLRSYCFILLIFIDSFLIFSLWVILLKSMDFRLMELCKFLELDYVQDKIHKSKQNQTFSIAFAFSHQPILDLQIAFCILDLRKLCLMKLR